MRTFLSGVGIEKCQGVADAPSVSEELLKVTFNLPFL